MNVPTRLGLFAGAAVLSFGAAFAVGSAVDLDIEVNEPGAHGTGAMEEGMDHDDA